MEQPVGRQRQPVLASAHLPTDQPADSRMLRWRETPAKVMGRDVSLGRYFARLSAETHRQRMRTVQQFFERIIEWE